MKLLAALLLSASSLVHAQAVQEAQDPAAIAAAQESAKQAATAWLALVDAGQYKASWEQGAGLLKNAVAVAQWETGVRGARMPVGTLKQRALTSTTYTTTLPGAPQGQYVVLQYASQFTDRTNAVETVTPMLDADGKWRVSGYFIR